MTVLNEKSFKAELNKLSSCNDICIALSGGVDSMVLLHLCVALKNQGDIASIRAIHINHGFSKNADQWQQHCADICAQWQIPFQAYSLTTQPNKGESIEAFARRERYQLLFDHMELKASLLTAQHQDDQAETFLLQALRGAGVYGLASMAADKQCLRPLLSFTKADVLAYAAQHQLAWVEDSSNKDTAFSRNFLRHHIMPLLKQHWPSTTKTLARAAALQAETMILLDDLGAMDLVEVCSDIPACLSIKKLAMLNPARQRHVIRFWLRQRSLPVPSQKQLETLFSDVIAAKADACPKLQWQCDAKVVVARRYRDDLFISLDKPLTIAKPLHWPLDQPLHLHADISLQASDVFTEDQQKQLDTSTLILKWSHEGASTKKYFQAQAVPPWWRECVPLFYLGDAWLKAANLRVLVDKYYRI